ncbi:MAG: carbohydrate-binding domain-containing protein [Ruminococcus sp.]|nr:carbohydrate-binding domain-containing protein [Ruminococcus sp.]
MKKRNTKAIVSGLVSACVLACAPAVGMMTASAADDIVYGDANCDGSLSMADSVLIMQSMANPSGYGLTGTNKDHITDEGQNRGDVAERGNGITNRDALAIQKKLLNLISELPESYQNGTSDTTTKTTQTTTPTTTVTTATTTVKPDEPEITVEANIKLNGNSITSDSEYAKAEGSVLTITHSGTFNISGKLDDGQICVNIPDENADSGTVKLVFNGVSITGKNAPAILVQNADKTSITVADGTENTITDGETAYSGDNLENALIEAKDDLTVKGGDAGTGKLTVTANVQPAVSCNNDLKFTGGDITIETLNDTDKTDAVKGKTSVTVKGGKLTINAEGDGLKSSKGNVMIEGGEVNIKSGKDAIQAETDLTVGGGKVIACGDRGLTSTGTISIYGCELLATATDNQCENIQATDVPTLMLNYTKEWAKNNPVSVLDGSGTAVFEANNLKKFRYAIVASEKMDITTEFKVYTGGLRMNHSGGDTFKAGFSNMTYNDVNNEADAEALYQSFFDQSTIHSVDIKMPESQWNTFIADAESESYYPCDVVIDGEEFKNAAIRTKGNSSRMMVTSAKKDKYSFRIKLDKYDKYQNYHGLTEFCMNNMFSDPSCMRDILCYNALDEIKGVAPDCAYTNMYLNDNLYSFYFLAEQPGTSLAERFATNDDAVLYKATDNAGGGGWNGFGGGGNSGYCSFTENMELSNFDVKFGIDDQFTHIADIKNAINRLTADNYKFIEDVIDVPSFLKGFAVNSVMCNYDSYNGTLAHNYYLMYNNGKAYFVGWDYNLALGNFMDNGQSVTSDIKTSLYQVQVSDRPLAKLLQVPEYYDMYVGYVKQIVDLYSDPQSAVDGYAALIKDAVRNDPRAFFGYDVFETNTTKSANGLQVNENGGNNQNPWNFNNGDNNNWDWNNNGNNDNNNNGFDWNNWDWNNNNAWGGFQINADEPNWGGFGGGGWGGGMWGGDFTFGGEKVSVVDFMIKRNEIIRNALGF